MPSGPPGLRGTHLRFAAPHPLRPVIHKVHLALLRVTPQAPRNGGMYARVRPRCRVQLGSRGALRAKEEIVHPASFVDPSTPSGSLSLYAVRSRSPHSASFTNSPLSARVGGGYYRHVALQPPLRSAHRPALAGALMLSFAALGNIIA